MTHPIQALVFEDGMARPLSKEETAMCVAYMEGFMSDDDATVLENRARTARKARVIAANGGPVATGPDEG
jgi:hypothetical protein